jgi:hypothetical protein
MQKSYPKKGAVARPGKPDLHLGERKVSDVWLTDTPKV